MSLRAIGWSGLDAVATAVLQLITITLMARLIGPRDFGLAALAFSLIILISSLASGLLNDALVQRKALHDSDCDSAFWLLSLLGGLAVLTCWLLSPWVGKIFRDPALGPIFAGMSVSLLPQAASAVPVALFRRALDFKRIAARNFFGRLAGTLVGLCMAFAGCGAWSFVGFRLTTAIASLFLVWSATSYRPGFTYSTKSAAALLRFAVPNVTTKLFDNSSERLFMFLVGFAFGATALGFVSIAFRLVTTLRSLIATALVTVALPVLARQFERPAQLRQYYRNASALASLIGFPIFACQFVLAEDIVVVILGEPWQAAVPVMQTVALLSVLLTTRMLCSTLLDAIGRPELSMVLSALHATASVLAAWFFVRVGIVEAVIAWASPIVIHLVVSAWVLRKVARLGLADQFGHMASPLLAVAVMLCFFHICRQGLVSGPDSLFILACLMPAGMSVYISVVLLLQPRLAVLFRPWPHAR